MSADSPSREPVDAAPARYTRALVDEALVHADDLADWSAKVDRQVLAAEVRALRAEHEPYEVLAPQSCAAGKHPEWLIDSEHSHACPWCQIEHLRDQIQRTDAIPSLTVLNPGLATRTPQPAAEPRALSSSCAGCGHAYNWHATSGDCRRFRCECDAFRDAAPLPAAPDEPSECGGCESSICPDCRPATAPRTPLTPLQNAAERPTGFPGTSDHPRSTEDVRGRT